MTTPSIKAVVVDDEDLSRKALQNLVGQYCQQIDIVAEAGDVASGIDAIAATEPDLVFLDIEMGVGSGFDLLEKTRNVDFEVVFTTAYDQYAIQAFKTHALGYLLKPIDLDELLQAEQRILSRVREKTDRSDMNRLLVALKARKNKVMFPTLDGGILLDPKEIVRLEAQGAYSEVYLTDGRKIVVSSNLKPHEETLRPFGFFRSHKSHLVNLRHVVRYRRGRIWTLTMSDRAEIKMAASKKEAFLAQLL